MIDSKLDDEGPGFDGTDIHSGRYFSDKVFHSLVYHIFNNRIH